jgi:hypothetical protein
MNDYFSDREKGPRARVNDKIDERVWNGIWALIDSRINDGSFGYSFPETCPDGGVICGTNYGTFKNSLEAEIPDITWSYHSFEMPNTYTILDLIEFCFKKIAKPITKKYHDYYTHNHYDFNVEKGQSDFRDDINRIFTRNGIAYELGHEGKIKRILPSIIGDEIIKTIFSTGDDELNNLLEDARKRFLDKKPDSRKDAIEKLWDAFERLKSLEHEDKKTSVKMLLDKVSNESNFRDRIESEAKELTYIGNNFNIRHSETNKTILIKDEHIEYLFYRLFSFILLILRSTGRLK